MSELLSEYDHQCLFFEWLEKTHYEVWKVSWSNKDGAWHGKDKKIAYAIAAKLKKAGGKEGVLDIVINIPRGKYTLLRIELKREIRPAPVSHEQKKMIDLLRNQGQAVFVCNGWQAAAELTNRYLNIKDSSC